MGKEGIECPAPDDITRFNQVLHRTYPTTDVILTIELNPSL